jgi:hypothetical protein
VAVNQLAVAEVRTMLRADALGLALGMALGALGLVTLGVSVLVRRRANTPAWLGLFALLYGVRLLVRTDTFRVAVDVAPAIGTRTRRSPMRFRSAAAGDREGHRPRVAPAVDTPRLRCDNVRVDRDRVRRPAAPAELGKACQQPDCGDANRAADDF